ncbi:MAG: hypothetical protein ACTSRC_19755 [Candidatus Helarchaeota archaeon]
MSLDVGYCPRSFAYRDPRGDAVAKKLPILTADTKPLSLETFKVGEEIDSVGKKRTLTQIKIY